MRQYLHSGEQTCLSAIKALGAGLAIDVSAFRHKIITLASAGFGAGDEMTVKIQGSQSKTKPDFDAAKTVSNRWDYIQSVDLENGDKINGNTGIPITFTDNGAADVRQFAANIDGMRWLNVEITANSDLNNAALTALIEVYND
jgi:hypothetical protein